MSPSVPCGLKRSGRERTLSLTEPSEAAEVKASLELFMNEMVINPFSAFSVGSSEAGERNVFKFLPWTFYF